MGTGRRLREANPSIKLISFQPDSPLHGLEGLKHMETAIVPGIYDPSLADEDMRVSTEDAYTMVRRLAREAGLLVGISGGAALAGALKVAKQPEMPSSSPFSRTARTNTCPSASGMPLRRDPTALNSCLNH